MNTRFGHWLIALSVAMFAMLATIGAASAGRRVALIVGNAKYEHADTLANTINDADAVAAMLNKAGFDIVDERRDVGVVEFKRALRDFTRAVSDADIAVVYYSGHGLEFGGTNYLVPVDAKLASDFDVDDETLSLDRVIQATEAANKLSLIILDACRDNPFLRTEPRAAAKRSVANRLVEVQPTSANTLIAYAAKAGSVSYDGIGANSPFTTALVKYLAQPGLDIRIALGKVRDEVLRSTGNRQEPFVYGSLGGDDISLVSNGAVEVAAPSSSAPSDASIASDYEKAERVGSADGWKAFLATHHSGYYATLAGAQLSKLTGVASVPAPPPRDPKDQRAALDRAAPAQTSDRAGNPTPDRSCRSETVELAQLRQVPSEPRVRKFASELTCEDLRPQVKRFLESLGIDAGEEKAVPSHVAVAPASAGQTEDSCKRDAAELVRIRANPDRASAVRFARDLKCEDLRSQASRLLESTTD